MNPSPDKKMLRRLILIAWRRLDAATDTASNRQSLQDLAWSIRAFCKAYRRLHPSDAPERDARTILRRAWQACEPCFLTRGANPAPLMQLLELPPRSRAMDRDPDMQEALTHLIGGCVPPLWRLIRCLRLETKGSVRT